MDINESATIYICGQPGTGKTATINYLNNSQNNEIEPSKFHRLEYIGYNYKNVFELLIQIIKDINKKICINSQIIDSDLNKDIAKSKIIDSLNKSEKYKIIVVDEIDNILKDSNGFDYLLPIPAKTQKTILIGIANTIDNFEKINAFYGTFKGFKQKQILFQTYSPEKIENIIVNKANRVLEKYNKTLYDLMASDALKVISKKVALKSGDFRLAIDLYCTVLDRCKNNLEKVSIKDVQKCINSKFGNSIRYSSIFSYLTTVSLLGNLSIYNKKGYS